MGIALMQCKWLFQYRHSAGCMGCGMTVHKSKR